MTLIPMKKRCFKCGKLYIWNPDVGQMVCPYCKGFGIIHVLRSFILNGKGKKL